MLIVDEFELGWKMVIKKYKLEKNAFLIQCFDV